MMEAQMINILLIKDEEVDVMNIKQAFKKNHLNTPLYIVTNGIEALNVL